MSGLSMQMIFSPQRCSLERLEQTLTTSRRKLAERLLRRYKTTDNEGGSHHTLLVGPRGSGKSHVLSYVRKGIEARNKSNDRRPRVVMLAEEERSIARPFDFVLALLRASGVAEIAVRNRIRGSDLGSLMKEAAAMFREQTQGKATLILAENFNDLLDAIGPEGLPSLRAFFQDQSLVSLLATSTTLWQQSDRPDNPFYGFFEIVTLRKLDRSEAHRHLKSLAEADSDDKLASALSGRRGNARVSAIHHLTGGNPRLLTMLGTFLTSENLENLVDPFVRMADRELTPYYQQRLDRLSPMQNKVVAALAASSTPLTATMIGEHNYLQPQVVSRALSDLMHCGFVKRSPRGRQSFYELREPLLRLVLDLKIAGEEPLRLIVNLLRLWYDAQELKGLLERAPMRAKTYFEAALSDTADLASRIDSQVSNLEDIAANPDLESEGTTMSAAMKALQNGRLDDALGGFDRVISAQLQNYANDGQKLLARALLHKGVVLGRLGRLVEALKIFEEFASYFGAMGVDGLQRTVVAAMFNRGLTLGHLGRREDELAAYVEIDQRFGRSDDPALQVQVARTLLNMGATLGKLGRWEDELAAYIEIHDRFGTSDRAELQEQVAKGLFNKGAVLGLRGHEEDALAAFAKILERYGASRIASLQELIATAMFNSGVALGMLGRVEEAVPHYSALIERFGKSEVLTLQQQVANALLNRGATREKAGQIEAALKDYEESIRLFGSSEQAEFQERVAKALFNRGRVLWKLGRGDDALAACDELANRFDDSASEVVLEHVAKAMVNKGVTLGRLGRAEEELKTYSELIKRFDRSDSAVLQEQLAKGMFNKGAALEQVGRLDEALFAYGDLLERFGSSVLDELDEKIANSMLNTGVLLGRLGRTDEELAAYEELENRFGASYRSDIQQHVAKALVNKGAALAQMGHLKEAKDVLDFVGRRFAADTSDDMRETLATGLVNKAATLSGLGQDREARNTYDQALALVENRDSKSAQDVRVRALTAKAQTYLYEDSFMEALATSKKAIELNPNDPLALGIHSEIQFCIGSIEDAIVTFDAFLTFTTPGGDIRRIATTRLISALNPKPSILRKVINHLGDDHESAIAGLLLWFWAQMPITEESAMELELVEKHLAEAFGDLVESELPLKMLNAARRNALGDSTALLELPLEVRRLIEPDAESQGNENDDSKL